MPGSARSPPRIRWRRRQSVAGWSDLPEIAVALAKRRQEHIGFCRTSLRAFPCLPDAYRFSTRITYPLGECADVGEGGVDEVEVEGEALDEGGADDGGVGGARNFGGLLRGADAEADGDRQWGETA